MSTELIKSDAGLDFHLEAAGAENDRWVIWVCCEGGFSRDGFVVGGGETRELAIADAEITLSGGAATLREQLVKRGE